MAKNNSAPNEKKSLKKEISYQLDQSLGKLKDFLGEKEYHSRIKKAVKILTSGIDKHKKAARKDPETTATVKAKPEKVVVAKKEPARKEPVKKAAVKKAAAQKQTPAPAKKGAKAKTQPTEESKS